MTGRRGAALMAAVLILWTLAVVAVATSQLGHTLREVSWESLRDSGSAPAATVVLDETDLDPALLGEIVKTPS